MDPTKPVFYQPDNDTVHYDAWKRSMADFYYANHRDWVTAILDAVAMYEDEGGCVSGEDLKTFFKLGGCCFLEGVHVWCWCGRR